MLDDINAAAYIGATTTPAKEKTTNPEIDKEAAWKGEFRQTLNDIRDKGFGAYTEEVRAEKLKEMRLEILARMGLTEENLAEMNGEQRAAIERAISREIRLRLSAERALEEEYPARAAAVAANGALLEQPGSAPNTGVGLAVLQVIEAADQARSEREKNDETG